MLESIDRLMGARNTRKLRQYQITFAMDCSQLMKIVFSAPDERFAFANYLVDIKILRGSIHHSEFMHIL